MHLPIEMIYNNYYGKNCITVDKIFKIGQFNNLMY